MTSDDLDWSAIQTPAGRATKVPALLADLEGRDPKIRAKGVQWLRRLSIFEGDTTPVAVPLAPRLVTIVKPKAPALAETLRLLADLLVCGSADAWLMRGYDVRIPAFEKAPPSQPGRALYEAIAVGVDRYIACLTHADVAVRANVAPLLAYLSRETASIEPALFERLPKEKDPAARGALALALAHQGQYAGDGRARDLLIEQSRSKDVLAAVGAAAGLVATLGAAAPDHVAQVLLEAVAKQRKKVDAFPFHGGIPANLAVIVAARFAGDRGDVGLAERLVNAAAKLPTAFWALGSLIDAAFAREPRPTPRAPGELDEKQIVAVRAVAASEHVERLTSGLDRAGLVADAAALACVAGDPPSTSLARVVDGEPLLRSAA
ncbi:MAG: hypothetical protein JNK04_15405, partial [Myxococcales bacterium]|nr:hypothetical protein [Myxococcales bacterium]